MAALAAVSAVTLSQQDKCSGLVAVNELTNIMEEIENAKDKEAREEIQNEFDDSVAKISKQQLEQINKSSNNSGCMSSHSSVFRCLVAHLSRMRCSNCMLREAVS